MTDAQPGKTIRASLVWKLSVVVVVILAVAIAISGYASDLICAHYSMESARAFLRFNSEACVRTIGRLMMHRDNAGIERLLTEASQDSAIFGDIRLISHHSGEVAVSRFEAHRTTLDLNDAACAVCHDHDDLGGDPTRIIDTVIRHPDGHRVLAVLVPIANDASCSEATCHAHADGPPVLGFLNVDYSLHPIDAQVTSRRVLILVAVIASTLVGVAATWYVSRRVLNKPLTALAEGTKRIAEGQLSFRFEGRRKDEIGVLERSFNAMAARLQSHRAELRTTMEYLGGIVENSADLIITVTTDGFIETFNRGAEQALGFSRAEIIGRHIESLFVDPAQRQAAIEKLRESGTVVKNYEARFLAKDGTTRDVLLTLSYLRDRNGNILGTLGISKDITQEKRLEQQLVQSLKLAAIGQAVTGIQHAIKNMLNSLKGGSYLVHNSIPKCDREQMNDGLTMLDEGIERISGLVTSMLNYAKELRLELSPVDLNELVEKVGRQNEQAAAAKGVTLRMQLTPDLPSMRCDSRLIHLAATDIVINGIDACAWRAYAPHEVPEVVLATRMSDKGDYFIIEIHDNGCGIPEEVRPHLFLPFFSTKKTQGTGLGLALTRRIIETHGGDVTFDSEPDRGTVFRINLPVSGPDDHREVADGETRPHR